MESFQNHTESLSRLFARYGGLENRRRRDESERGHSTDPGCDGDDFDDGGKGNQVSHVNPQVFRLSQQSKIMYSLRYNRRNEFTMKAPVEKLRVVLRPA